MKRYQPSLKAEGLIEKGAAIEHLNKIPLSKEHGSGETRRFLKEHFKQDQ